jgi:peptidase E
MEAKGIIALMGSGELTSTMVEVHKSLLSGLAVAPQAVFLDTPAGFQLNVNQLSERAEDYFIKRVGTTMQTASLTSKDVPPQEAEEAYRVLRGAGYVLVGPGSPTYAVQQWRETPIPEILQDRVRSGGCLVAASAAALTVGRFTLPVYEIYKVGSELYWEEGLDILGRFGSDLVVIPHWNNAEGGTHDTRFCYMGESRFRRLENLLPGELGVLGLDEHTACLIDLAADEAWVAGIGRVTLRRGGREISFAKGDRFPLEVLRTTPAEEAGRSHSVPNGSSSAAGREPQAAAPPADSFWDRIHGLESDFQEGLERQDGAAGSHALLELDRLIWEALQARENPEDISQAREILRELIVYLGQHGKAGPEGMAQKMAPLVEALLARREELRHEGHWEQADEVRDVLDAAGVGITDTPQGPRWEMSEEVS